MSLPATSVSMVVTPLLPPGLEAVKRRDERIDNVFSCLIDMSDGDAPICITQSITHTLACGNRARLTNVEVRVCVREYVTVTIDFELCKPLTRRVSNLQDAAATIVNIMDDGKLCLECSTVYVGTHRCEVEAVAIIVGRKKADCCVCLSECVGATVFECKHVAHMACAERVEDARCPICRRSISVVDEF